MRAHAHRVGIATYNLGGAYNLIIFTGCVFAESTVDMACKKKRSIITKNLGAGVWILDRLGLFNCHPAKS